MTLSPSMPGPNDFGRLMVADGVELPRLVDCRICRGPLTVHPSGAVVFCTACDRLDRMTSTSPTGPSSTRPEGTTE